MWFFWKQASWDQHDLLWFVQAVHHCATTPVWEFCIAGIIIFIYIVFLDCIIPLGARCCAISLQDHILAFGGLVPCVRVPWQCSEGSLATAQT